MIRITYACISDTGIVRKINQDNFICGGHFMEYENDATDFPLSGQMIIDHPALFGVFDGLGGEERGEVASYLTAWAASKHVFHMPIAESLIDLCRRANALVCSYASDNGVSSMGTTAAMIAFSNDQVTMCNIGDSRIYGISENGIRQISVDHLGFAPFGVKPPLSQCIGIPEDSMIIEPYTLSLDYGREGTFIICSDGLTDMVSDEKIFSVARKPDLTAASRELVWLAKENGGKDNITVLLIRYVKE